MNGGGYNQCGREAVEFTETLLTMYHVTADGPSYNIVQHNNFARVTGTGLVSGDEHLFNGAGIDQLYIDDRATKFTSVSNVILVNQETGGVQRWELLQHTTFVDGKRRVVRVELREVCRG